MSSIEFDASLKAVLDQLDKLPAKFEANLVRGALRAAAKPILDDARSRVPVKTGALRDSLRISSAIKKRAGEISASVKAGGGKGRVYYAHMVESGVAQHIIEGPVAIGGRVFKNVPHPGFVGRGFMRAAFDNAGQASIDAYGAYIRKNLPKMLAKAGVTDGD